MRSRIGRTVRIVAAASCVAFLAAACGDADTADEASPSPSTPAPSSAADEDTASDAATSPSDTPAPDESALTSLIAAAQEEGDLTFYATPSENVVAALAEAFSEEYGIDAQFLRLGGADIETRFSAEAEAGTFTADVLIGTDSTSDPESGFFAEAESNGWIAPLSDELVPGYPFEYGEEFLRRNRAVIQIQPWLISYNTEIVTDPPTSYEDLLDPRFTDLIVTSNPESSGASTQFWVTLLDEYGVEFLEAFQAQNPNRFDGGAVPASEALAAGEGGVQVPSVGALVAGARERGAPVEAVLPETTTGVEIVLAMPDPARVPHPNAAKLFAHYVMAGEGHEVFNSFEGVFSPLADPGPNVPSDYRVPPDLTDEAIATLRDALNL